MLYIKSLDEKKIWSYDEFRNLMKRVGVKKLSISLLKKLGYKIEYRALRN